MGKPAQLLVDPDEGFRTVAGTHPRSRGAGPDPDEIHGPVCGPGAVRRTGRRLSSGCSCWQLFVGRGWRVAWLLTSSVQQVIAVQGLGIGCAAGITPLSRVQASAVL